MKPSFFHYKLSSHRAAALFLSGALFVFFGNLSEIDAAAAGVNSHTEQITDPAINMTAFTVEVPAGWKFVGTILRPRGCHAPALPASGLSYSAVAPDGITATMQLPGSQWSWASDGSSPMGPKCGPIDITSAAGYLLNIAIPNMHPTAKILGIVPLSPQMQQGLEAARRNLQSSGNYGSLQIHRTLDTAAVRIEYSLDGHIVQEQLGTVVTCQGSDFPAYPQMHRPARTQRSCMSHTIFVKRAPKGQLDHLVALSLPNAQIDQQWDAEISQRMRRAFDQYQKASDAQFQAIQNHYRQVTANMVQRGQEFNDNLAASTRDAMAADSQRQGAIDKAAHGQVLDSLNRQDYMDPTTGQKIETSNQFNHSWISSDKSEVVLNGDPTLDPNGVVDPVREGWTELIPVN